MAERWSLEGDYVMGCNCDYGCPCNFNARPSVGHCEGVIAVVASRGRYGDIPLDGLKAASVVRWPGAIHEGNGEGVYFVDTAGSDAQQRALAAILMGEAGGPIGIIAGTIARKHGPHAAPIDIRVAGKESRLTVGDDIRLVFDTIKNPVTGADAFSRVVLSPGLLTDELEEFTTSEFVADSDPVSMSHPGRVGQLAKLRWEGP